MSFKLHTDYKPAGDQPKAIEQLTNSLNLGQKQQTLLGVTGSGKTFTVANIIQNIQKPTLVLAHNKTLAAQLFAEFKDFFPENSVNYFVSYYDYYQPEAYVPSRDLFIEKESDINADIERYRNAATQSALSRKDFIIVASVSCIYGIGSPEDYTTLSREVKVGQTYPRNKLLAHLTDMQYYRSEYDFYTGLFRVRGDSVDIYLVSEEQALRIDYFGDEIESLKLINPISGEVISRPDKYTIYPAKQYVTPFERIKTVTGQIREDLAREKDFFLKQGKVLEATRLEQRVNYDLEMLEEVGYCQGIENYSRYLDGRQIGTPPSTLLDYMGEDWLMVVDESHMTIPQIGGMYNGDRARKQTLVDYGFRLQAALDNRPLKFNEFEEKLNQIIYVSATPAEFELQFSQASVKQAASAKPAEYKELIAKDGISKTGVVEQIIRPTGLLDPLVHIRPTTVAATKAIEASVKESNLAWQEADLAQAIKADEIGNQIDDLIVRIRETVGKGQRVLVTTLTKRMAEELTEYLQELKIKVQYIHSDIDAIERVAILRDLRLGKYDVLIGINLLREGLDLPEVSLVGILDADKEGFLRSETSFVQIIGRAARHSEGTVFMYADRVTQSMLRALTETKRRREIQEAYNREHGITPRTVISKIKDQLERQTKEEEDKGGKTSLEQKMESYRGLKPKEKKRLLKELEVEMQFLADNLEFEKAAQIRDFINEQK
jgi:excinuclease ABC subunit B